LADDAAGNTTAMTDPNGALVGLGYDDTNRLTAVTSGGA
jgi:YD repeat-containing protein